ncbi:hypothetical protein FZZ93_02405 [Halomonas eurihalina]|uniref:Uncharacterized protein n=1 Tax=Halomonas eurihalina TaxID=42566 RepID=A0A5D9DC94_HALER|nr:hypothetical protein [Halomonas eurihalina]MDR5857954.1 hypothetical protein [Halomonas eurihalina]TZG41534.1 hypothetical protein FZZ93_02405 [Halomonas eurihalina]
MFKVNLNRTYQYPVTATIYDEEGKEHTGKFKARFKVLPHDEAKELPEDTSLLEAVLTGVSDLEIPGPDGQSLAGEALVEAVKNDPALALATQAAYQDSIAKKNRPRS